MKYNNEIILKLNDDINKYFLNIFPVDEDMYLTHEGVSRLVMIDRYAQKDKNLKSLSEGDIVITVVKEDINFPTRGIGKVIKLSWSTNEAIIELEEEFCGALESDEERESKRIKRSLNVVEKPLELYYEQIAKRVAYALSREEKSEDLKENTFVDFYNILKDMSFVPAGRVLFGAGSGNEVTFFNCFVMPMIQDSRGGISEHRKEVMEIMSRGGGVGTNGSSLRPKYARAKTVGGRSSGAVSWLNDLSGLTHLVEQGGSRRGAQMIMMADWHPDVIEFIISKMQNPKILQFLIENSKSEIIVEAAKEKLSFTPLTPIEKKLYNEVVDAANQMNITSDVYEEAAKKLQDGGTYSVNEPDFLTGANISVNITSEFMDAVFKDEMYQLRYPDLDALEESQKEFYDENWHEIGDVREWEKLGYPVKVYYEVKARELWDLINVCATYSAEPGVFFIDNANDMTNAVAYDQKIVATNPCGEQPLAPYSVCNLAAVNLSNVVDKHTGEIDYDKLKHIVKVGVRMQDNVIDVTPYFLEANKEQALGERRVGLGVMGLHDLLIWNKKRYGSVEGNEVVSKVMQTIAESAYEASIELAQEKGSFPLLVNRDKMLTSGYIKKLPEHIKNGIKKYGIRNSHLLTIAPTGSTGTMVGVSTGLEPYFSFKYFRSGRLGKFIEVNAKIVDEWLKHNPEYNEASLPEYFVSAMELSADEHVEVQCVIQYWIDSSISKTVNAPKGYSVKDVEKIYEKLYLGGAKGGTVYVDGSRESQVLSLTNEDVEITEQLDLELNDKKEDLDTSSIINKQDKDVGVEVGNVCPICKEGKVIDSGGCNTCSNCGAQLKCGL
ncbi:MAG: vitamin B12-dependent ribonucleotide reductase [Bacilli bacterium]